MKKRNINLLVKTLATAQLVAMMLPMVTLSQGTNGGDNNSRLTVVTAAENKTPVETDKRVQSHGLPWRFAKTPVFDKDRPRVLLIGDSILNGYLPHVKSSLEGKAYVDAWVNPYHHSKSFNEVLAHNLTNGPYAVIHINLGLHGFQNGRIPPGQYEPLTRSIIEVIQQQCPKAQIIWATTTPIIAKDKPIRIDPELNPIIVAQNEIAKMLMMEMRVHVDDLYAVATNQLDHAAGGGDQFHWQSSGYKVFGTAVANEISAVLSDKKTP